MGRFIKYIGSPCSAMRRALSLLNQNNTPAYIPKLGDIIVHNSTTNEDKIVSYEEWLQLEDSWDITGLYGINTYEEETAEDGSYVIMSNGTTLIINPDDYDKVNDHWEQVDTIYKSITYDYVEIGGIKWATKNVGAKTITDFGQKFSWGGVNGYTNDQVSGGYHAFYWTDYELGDGGNDESNMTKYNSTDGKTVLDSEDDAATVNMGSGWRMPTTAEFEALGAATTSAWTDDYEDSGVAGLILTSKADTSIKLFFPAAGRCSSGNVYNVGSYGCYWSRSLETSSKYSAYYMNFDSSDVSWDDDRNRCMGYSVRGVVDE